MSDLMPEDRALLDLARGHSSSDERVGEGGLHEILGVGFGHAVPQRPQELRPEGGRRERGRSRGIGRREGVLHRSTYPR